MPSANEEGETGRRRSRPPPPQLNRIHESESRGFKEFEIKNSSLREKDNHSQPLSLEAEAGTFAEG